MKIVICDTPEQAGASAAARIAALLNTTDHPVLGLATGSSPQPLYHALSKHVADGLDLSHVDCFALDEYVGIPRNHPESYHSIINRHATGPLRLNPARVHVPDGQRDDPDAGAVEYDTAIATAGGVEIQILGIGANGHIGFNEPGAPMDSRTRVVPLAASTIAANSRFFDSIHDVPTHAVTQGIATILSAAHIVLVANGTDKAEAIKAAVEGPISPGCPASYLQEHQDAVFFLNTEAASLLNAPSPMPSRVEGVHA